MCRPMHLHANQLQFLQILSANMKFDEPLPKQNLKEDESFVTQ